MLMVPLLSFWAMTSASDVAITLFIASFALTVAVVRIRIPNLAAPKINEFVPITIAITLVGATLAILIMRGGLSYINLSFAKVYDYRSLIYENIITGPMSYLVPWTGKCANIVLLSYALWRKKNGWFAIIAALQLLLFALASNKEYIFYPLICLFFYFEHRWRYKTAHMIMLTMALLNMIAWGVYLAFGSIDFGAVVLMRTFFSQALNSFQYFDFFQVHQFVLWSNSILSSLSANPYDVPVAEIIGAGRYGINGDTFANTGYLGSGYMHCGATGTVLYAVLVGAMLKFFDVFAGPRTPLAMGGTLAFVAAAQLINVDLTTVFVSSGVFLSYILLFLLRGSAARHLPQYMLSAP
jgi:hypothetical protein